MYQIVPDNTVHKKCEHVLLLIDNLDNKIL